VKAEHLPTSNPVSFDDESPQFRFAEVEDVTTGHTADGLKGVTGPFVIVGSGSTLTPMAWAYVSP
jgi:hypothetical protein